MNVWLELGFRGNTVGERLIAQAAFNDHDLAL